MQRSDQTLHADFFRLQEFVALKIALADTTQDHIDREVLFYRLIKTHGQDRGASRLVGLKDYFQH